jgi:hypothetical protein
MKKKKIYEDLNPTRYSTSPSLIAKSSWHQACPNTSNAEQLSLGARVQFFGRVLVERPWGFGCVGIVIIHHFRRNSNPSTFTSISDSVAVLSKNHHVCVGGVGGVGIGGVGGAGSGAVSVPVSMSMLVLVLVVMLGGAWSVDTTSSPPTLFNATMLNLKTGSMTWGSSR